MRIKSLFIIIIGLLLLATPNLLIAAASPGGGGGGSGGGGGGSSSNDPCKTTGPLVAGTPVPSTYSYTLGEAGSQSGYVPVTAPQPNNANCDPNLPNEWGTTGLKEVSITMYVQSVTDTLGYAVDQNTSEAVKDAFSFGYTNPALVPSASGQISFTFTNSSSIPAGSWAIHFKTNSGGKINDVNANGFVLTVVEPLVGDSQPPDITINSPTGNPKILVNGTLNVSFTAKDPDEGGVGTGIYAMGAKINSSGGAFEEGISLTTDSSLPVIAGTNVTASGAVQMNQIGSYLLTAEAKDGCAFPDSNLNCEWDADDHISSAGTTFAVAVSVQCLPPISIANRQFNSGSTVPVKWTFTDADGAFLPPYASIQAMISGPSGLTAYAGNGASNIRWEVDTAGHATQYIVSISSISPSRRP